jgi:large subunit ribosomal protein L31
MKKDIHPDYKEVVFQDVQSDFKFLTRSTLTSEEKIKWEDGKEYPLIKVEVSSASHPFYTGKKIFVDTAGRVEKFNQKYKAKVAVKSTPKEKVEVKKEEAPVAETPKEETPKEEAPVAETPKEETPKEEAPVAETPKEEAPKEETPKEEAPKEEAPKEETPNKEAPKSE